MTREELNNLKEGDIVKVREFPYAPEGMTGEVVEWTVSRVYLANLDDPTHFGRLAITRESIKGIHAEFVNHLRIED